MPAPRQGDAASGAECSEAEGWNLVAIGIGAGSRQKGKIVEKKAAKTVAKSAEKTAHKKKPFSSREGLAASRRLDSGRSLDPAPQLATPTEGGSGAEEGYGTGNRGRS